MPNINLNRSFHTANRFIHLNKGELLEEQAVRKEITRLEHPFFYFIKKFFYNVFTLGLGKAIQEDRVIRREQEVQDIADSLIKKLPSKLSEFPVTRSLLLSRAIHRKCLSDININLKDDYEVVEKSLYEENMGKYKYFNKGIFAKLNNECTVYEILDSIDIPSPYRILDKESYREEISKCKCFNENNFNELNNECTFHEILDSMDDPALLYENQKKNYRIYIDQESKSNNNTSIVRQLCVCSTENSSLFPGEVINLSETKEVLMTFKTDQDYKHFCNNLKVSSDIVFTDLKTRKGENPKGNILTRFYMPSKADIRDVIYKSQSYEELEVKHLVNDLTLKIIYNNESFSLSTNGMESYVYNQLTLNILIDSLISSNDGLSSALKNELINKEKLKQLITIALSNKTQDKILEVFNNSNRHITIKAIPDTPKDIKINFDIGQIEYLDIQYDLTKNIKDNQAKTNPCKIKSVKFNIKHDLDSFTYDTSNFKVQSYSKKDNEKLVQQATKNLKQTNLKYYNQHPELLAIDYSETLSKVSRVSFINEAANLVKNPYLDYGICPDKLQYFIRIASLANKEQQKYFTIEIEHIGQDNYIIFRIGNQKIYEQQSTEQINNLIKKYTIPSSANADFLNINLHLLNLEDELWNPIRGFHRQNIQDLCINHSPFISTSIQNLQYDKALSAEELVQIRRDIVEISYQYYNKDAFDKLQEGCTLSEILASMITPKTNDYDLNNQLIKRWNKEKLYFDFSDKDAVIGAKVIVIDNKKIGSVVSPLDVIKDRNSNMFVVQKSMLEEFDNSYKIFQLNEQLSLCDKKNLVMQFQSLYIHHQSILSLLPNDELYSHATMSSNGRKSVCLESDSNIFTYSTENPMFIRALNASNLSPYRKEIELKLSFIDKFEIDKVKENDEMLSVYKKDETYELYKYDLYEVKLTSTQAVLHLA